MGLNVNLIKMLGVKPISDCPRCYHQFENRYSDYDIETDCNIEEGTWKLLNYCPQCECEFYELFDVHVSRAGTKRV